MTIDSEMNFKTAAMNTKIAAMSDSDKEARVQEIYAMPTSKCTDDAFLELFTIMLGDTPSSAR